MSGKTTGEGHTTTATTSRGAVWRVGRKVGRTLYREDRLVGIVDDAWFADELVAAANAAIRSKGVLTAEPVSEPHDAGPALRRHTITGWWQVWSGGICIALLRPEDVADALREERSHG